MAHLTGVLGWTRDEVGSDGGVNDDDMLVKSGIVNLELKAELLLTWRVESCVQRGQLPLQFEACK